MRLDPAALALTLTRLKAGEASTKSKDTNVVNVEWPYVAAVGGAEMMVVIRTLVVPMGLAFNPGKAA